MSGSLNLKKSETAYPLTEQALRDQAASLRLDTASFSRPLQRCDLTECRGTCCYDGVYVNQEEAEVLRKTAKSAIDFFKNVGISDLEDPIVEGTWEGAKLGQKTATVAFPFSKVVPEFPKHFQDTRCVFLTSDARCSLQLLAVSEGRHPWYYKPITCWLHPITMRAGAINLPSKETDPHITATYPGFVSASPCGGVCKKGPPASETLKEEVDFLGKIIGRNLLAEIKKGTAPA